MKLTKEHLYDAVEQLKRFIDETDVPIIYLTKDEYTTLITEGTVTTSSGKTYKYDDDAYYAFEGTSSGDPAEYYQPLIYSTDEREVGVWTDGKPLYQKTYEITSTVIYPSGTAIAGIDISGMDAIIKAEGADSTLVQSATLMAYNNNGLMVSSSLALLIDRITLWYTKTADTAGSGIWTPSGVPAVHYSTDEHVIGTWIDGSTLYEKTITASISNRVQWIDTGVDNTSTIVYSEGFLEHSGGITTLASADPDGQAGINTFIQSVVTTGKWSVLYRAKQEHTGLHAGDLTVTIRYTKSS